MSTCPRYRGVDLMHHPVVMASLERRAADAGPTSKEGLAETAHIDSGIGRLAVQCMRGAFTSRSSRVADGLHDAPDSVPLGGLLERQSDMAKATVEVLVDDLDGSEAIETVRIGWNGDWRELDLSKRNLSSLSRVLDNYWNAARPVRSTKRASRKPAKTATRARSTKASRDPKLIRAWAIDNGIPVPARGRIPTEVEQQYNGTRDQT